MKLRVFRTGKDLDHSVYDIDPEPGMTVLGALFHIQENIDDSLSFRYSCRGAVCGSCAMLINRVPRLACRTQLRSLLDGTAEISVKSLKPYPAITQTPEAWKPESEILVEPLPHLPVVKDLVVDMAKFFDSYRAIEPVLRPGGRESERSNAERERMMQPGDVKELENFTNCILCGSCYGACPVDGKNPDYMGPAALAKLYRFHIDPREREEEGQEKKVEGRGTRNRLSLADSPNGWWACEFHSNCAVVCPKGVPPNRAIGKARQELKKMKINGN
jgi:succinate dehydrogenase / fumarate reductase iron-sulfur subunit